MSLTRASGLEPCRHHSSLLLLHPTGFGHLAPHFNSLDGARSLPNDSRRRSSLQATASAASSPIHPGFGTWSPPDIKDLHLRRLQRRRSLISTLRLRCLQRRRGLISTTDPAGSSARGQGLHPARRLLCSCLCDDKYAISSNGVVNLKLQTFEVANMQLFLFLWSHNSKTLLELVKIPVTN